MAAAEMAIALIDEIYSRAVLRTGIEALPAFQITSPTVLRSFFFHFQKN